MSDFNAVLVTDDRIANITDKIEIIGPSGEYLSNQRAPELEPVQNAKKDCL